MKPSSQNLIWIDLEMTGLNPEHDRILEIASIVTDKHLNVLAEGPCFAIKTSKAILAKMDDWNKKHHAESGLIERVLQSKITLKQAQEQTIEFLTQYVPKGKSPLCGNSIGQDRRFLFKYMPELEQYFHYRNLDVSTLKILAQKWYPKTIKMPPKKSKHVALSDIYGSIAELQYYRENMLVKAHKN